MNPGISTVFPWLALASLPWQQYKWIDLRVEYLTRVAATHSGSVIGAFEYDVNQPIPDGEVIMSAYQGCQEGVVWQDQNIRLNTPACHPAGQRRYVRTADVDDLSKYDGAKLLMGSVGSTTAQALGKIWVHYKIQLYIPQAQPLQNPPTDGAKRQYNSGSVPVTAPNTASPIDFGDLTVDKIKEYITKDGSVFTVRNAMKLRAFVACAAGAQSTASYIKCGLILNKNGLNVASNFASAEASTGQTAQVNLSKDYVFDFQKNDTFSFDLSNKIESDADVSSAAEAPSLLLEFLGFTPSVSQPAALLSMQDRKGFPPPSDSESTPDSQKDGAAESTVHERLKQLEKTLSRLSKHPIPSLV